jgi:hypothetical protein
MGKTVVSPDGRFEWDEEKDALNKQNMDFISVKSWTFSRIRFLSNGTIKNIQP